MRVVLMQMIGRECREIVEEKWSNDPQLGFGSGFGGEVGGGRVFRAYERVRHGFVRVSFVLR